MSFENTTDPERVTSDDVARWCEELGAFIRANADAPELWFAHSFRLNEKIRAAVALQTDTGSVT